MIIIPEGIAAEARLSRIADSVIIFCHGCYVLSNRISVSIQPPRRLGTIPLAQYLPRGDASRSCIGFPALLPGAALLLRFFSEDFGWRGRWRRCLVSAALAAIKAAVVLAARVFSLRRHREQPVRWDQPLPDCHRCSLQRGSYPAIRCPSSCGARSWR